MAVDDKVVIGLTHGLDDAESVLIAYLLGVEALRKDKQVVMWLTKSGIDKKRLSSKGWGAKNPLVPGNTEESRKANRRVEFVIVE